MCTKLRHDTVRVTIVEGLSVYLLEMQCFCFSNCSTTSYHCMILLRAVFTMVLCLL